MKTILPQRLREPLIRKFPQLPLFAPLLFILGLMSIAFGFYIVRYQQLQKKTVVQQVKKADPYLHILNASPSSKSILPTEITITFSEPIDPHLVSQFFLISPSIPGHFMETDSPQTVTFTPDHPFERGVSYSFQLGLGLMSKNGKVLQNDYQHSFDTELASDQVKFINKELTGRVFTFGAGRNETISVKKGSGIGELTISIYKSTPQQLLAYLAYKETTITEYGYERKIDSYFSSDIHHNPFQLVQSQKSADFDINLPIPKDVGLYYVEAIGNDGKPLGSSYIVVNKTGLLFRQDDHHMTLGAFDIASGEQIKEPVSVKLYSSRDSVVTQKSIELTDLSESIYDFNQPLDFILATYKQEQIFVPVHLPQSQADIQVTEDLSKSYKTFVYTDRPIYKPGDTVQFRGVVRSDNDAQYTLPPDGVTVNISVGLPGTQKKIETTATTQPSGIFWGFLTIPADFKSPDQYSLTAFLTTTINGKSRSNWYGDTYFDITVAKPEYLKQHDISFEVHAKGFDGKPLANQTISYDLYEENFYEVEKAVYNSSFNVGRGGFGMCGGGFSPFEEYYGTPLETAKTLTTDENGKASLTYSLKDKLLDSSEKLTLVAYKTDAENNKVVSAVSTIVHASDQNIFLAPSPYRYVVGDTISASFHAEALSGDSLKNQTVHVTLQDYVQPSMTSKVYVQQLVTTDDKGNGTTEFIVPQLTTTTKGVNLVISSTDQYGNTSQAVRYIEVDANKPTLSYWDRSGVVPIFLKMKTDKNSYTVGDTITISTNSPQDLTALLTLERGRIYQPRIIHIPKGDSTLSIPVTDELSPSITAVFSFFENDQYHTEGLTLNVPAMHKLMNISVTPDKPSYNPGETAKLTITTKDKNNLPVAAKVSLAVIDKAIFALRKNATPPIHSTFYAFRPRKTNSSSSLINVGEYNYGGRGGGGGGSGLDGKNVDTLFWNPNITVPESGTITIDVPLSTQVTTWRALVYGTTDTTLAGQADVDFLASN